MSPVVLITGASRGIGAATALLAAEAGYAVAVNYSANSLAADEVVRQIRAAGGTAMSVQADVADAAQIMAMFEKVDAKLGRLSALVNNAGVVDATSRVDAMSMARFKRMFDINVLGSLVCAREAVRSMSTRHGREGIRVNAVRPGIIETEIHASGGLPNRARDMAPSVPMQRAGSAKEVAQSIVWLLSPASSYVTGTILDVTGGR